MNYNYNEVVAYINDIPKFTKKNSMDHTQRFMELLGIKEEKFQIIHVAGTNGKGSTCAYMNGILCELNEQVGMFTSPHLEEMTERIRINGKEISKRDFVLTFDEVQRVVDEMKQEGYSHPTFFEFLLGMAMKAFAMSEMKYVILETGLGGRLDATNVFSCPRATIITSIGLDHEQYLGNTLEEIAGEKSGIIKKNVPVIYVGNDIIVDNVISSKVKMMDCKCRKITNSAYEIIEKTEKYIAFYQQGEYDKIDTWKIQNRGSYQVENAMLAIETLRMILPEVKADAKAWKQGLMKTAWAGRMEEISQGIFVDGAHNVSAIQAIVQDNKQVDGVLFSAVSDKDYTHMIEILTREMEVGGYVVTTIDDKRGVPAIELAQLIEEFVSVPVYVEETVEAAMKRLTKLKTEQGKVLCLGSLYLVGMVKEYCNKERIKE